MNRPFIIAGPCSGESPAQLRYTAEALKKEGNIDFFRAGIWKPRSHPAGFQGQGTKALAWLTAIQEEFQLPAATEVASTAHVEAVLKAGLKGVWIGARTTVNPFAVQEIASALSGSEVKVFVKNPVNPDVSLWVGAFERLYNAGVTDLVAIHRGFSVYKQGEYRNAPIWLVPLELKRYLPHVPLLCDPSHISGNSQWVPMLAQKAMDLYFDGLMIEVHPNPKEALSDAQQQLTISEYHQMMSHLVQRTPDAPNYELSGRLEELRMQIDLCDDHLVALLAQRMQVVKEIGLIKREGGMAIFQQKRWDELIARIKQQGDSLSVSSTFLELLFAQIHQEAIIRQQEMLLPEAKETDIRYLIPDSELDIPNQEQGCIKPQAGAIDNVVELLNGKNAILLVDKEVDERYKDRLPPFPKILINAQEKYKTLDTVKKIAAQLMKQQTDRTFWLVGIGGGIVCDITGFMATIYMRGVRFALVPTTLLAQADAAIGGKNGVNVDGVKNMVGCITRPQWILCDTGLLNTLSQKQIRSGLGEVIKHALIGAPKLLDYMENHTKALLALDPEAIQNIITASQLLKYEIVSQDERENGTRRILNFGHTIGHAIEAVDQRKNRQKYMHGEAVAVGMMYAVALSVIYAQWGETLLPRLKKLYEQLSLPAKLPCSIDDLCTMMLLDKKREDKTIRFILLKAIGSPYEQEIPINEIKNALQWAHERVLAL